MPSVSLDEAWEFLEFLPGASFGATSVQLKGWLHRAFPRKRYQMRHLVDFIAFLEGRRSIQLSYGRPVFSFYFNRLQTFEQLLSLA